MKVLREGKLPGEKIFQGTCHNCRARVEFTAKEATRRSDSKAFVWFEVNCPTIGCKQWIAGVEQ